MTNESHQQDNKTITELSIFANEIGVMIESTCPEDFAHNRQLPPDYVIFRKCNLENLRERLVTILGEDRLEQFFQDCEPKGAASKLEIIMFLVNLLVRCSTVMPGESVSAAAAEVRSGADLSRASWRDADAEDGRGAPRHGGPGA
jgi:hypothetical protein